MAGLVFDLGGTHLRAATVTADGRLQETVKSRLVTLADGATAPQIWSDIRTRLRDYLAHHLDDTPAGSPLVLAFPGPIDERGQILQAPTLTGSDPTIPDLRGELQRLSGRPVFLINDLSAAAWYLSRAASGRMIVVTVSSGIGSKLFDPVAGVCDDVAYAGEIGHTVVDTSAQAVRCDCGGRGHLGAIASGRGIERYSQRRADSDPEEFAQSRCATHFGATAATLNNESHLVPALCAGDSWAREVVLHCVRYLARSLVQNLVMTGARRIVVIGGFALATGEPFLELLRQAAEECCDYELLRGKVAKMIVLGDAAEEACLVGSAVYLQHVARS